MGNWLSTTSQKDAEVNYMYRTNVPTTHDVRVNYPNRTNVSTQRDELSQLRCQILMQRQIEKQHAASLLSVRDTTSRTPSADAQKSSYISVSKTNSQTKPVLINYVMNYGSTIGWSQMSNLNAIKFVELSSDSSEYRTIEKLFRNSNKRFFKVSNIERIQNPYLYGTYLLKKEELQGRYGHVEEKLLFHGTKKRNIDSICSENFDWRRHGEGTGHRFGRGVSFTPISNYATHYCDKKANIKIMLVAKVLISNPCTGNPQMVLPPIGFDTTQKEDGHVIVKYNDNEFYPAYKVSFFKVNPVSI